MANYIKKALPQKAQDVSLVDETARRMLADIKENGDVAVSRYAAELDKWHTPAWAFRRQPVGSFAARTAHTDTPAYDAPTSR